MPSADKLKHLHEHKPHFGAAKYVKRSEISSGDVVSFMYDGEQRWVMVLDPDFEGKLHGLTLGTLPRRTLIDKIIDPMYDHGEPYDLYYKALYKTVAKWDTYRTYNIPKIGQMRRMAYYVKPKPVFKRGQRVS
jgi:hypothetical protein